MRKPRSRPEEEAADSGATARQTALGLLARREHSRRELSQKLAARGYMTATVEEVLARLAAEGLLSDARFAETYVCSRVQRGCGPLRIRDELRARGVDQALIDDRLHAFDDRWREQIERVRSKRFGPAMPVDFRERARQMRFLQQRGFTPEQIHDLLGD